MIHLFVQFVWLLTGAVSTCIWLLCSFRIQQGYEDRLREITKLLSFQCRTADGRRNIQQTFKPSFWPAIVRLLFMGRRRKFRRPRKDYTFPALFLSTNIRYSSKRSKTVHFLSLISLQPRKKTDTCRWSKQTLASLRLKGSYNARVTLSLDV